MTDKERLEEIRNRMIVEKHYFKYLNSERGYWENVYTLLEQDMNYLFNTIIEQAERVEELEEENEQLEDDLNVMQNYYVHDLKVQNERYKHALKFGVKYLQNSNIRQIQLVVSALKKALEDKE